MNVLKGTKLSRLVLLLGLSLFVGMVAIACSDDDDAAAPDSALKIGYLADFSGPLAEFGPAIETGVRLAIKHINDAGGVNGFPVELVVGDDRTDATAAVEEARRLIDIEGVTAIVGPLASGVAIAVAESVAAGAGVVVISPSATSPAVTDANDDDFLFRSTTSDAAQGVILADLAAEEGLTSVGILYVNNAYGQGLRSVFEGAFGGDSVAASYEPAQASYLSELQAAAAGGATTLVAIGYPTEAQVFIREALENNLFANFLFVDGTKSLDLVTAIGAAQLEGMKGTAPVGGPETDAARAWAEAYIAEHGEVPNLPFIREAYDATIAIALAAARAKSHSGEAIRDALREVAGPPGTQYTPGADSVRAALEAAAAGNDMDFEGAATSLNWDDNGDIATGYIGIWEFRGGEIVELREVAFDLSQ